MDVCRICLATGVRMFTLALADFPLQQVCEKMVNTPFVIHDSGPVAACSICYCHLKQCYELMRISQQAEELFTEILSEFSEITTECVAMIDRKGINLCSSLKTAAVQYFDSSSFDGPIIIKDEIELKYKEETVEKSPLMAVCRLCLATDVHMFSIANTPLQFVYESLTDTLLQTADKRPTTVCFICFARLMKCRRLMLRASRAEKVMTSIMEKYSELSKKAVAMIDRDANALCPLSVRPTECFDSLDDQPTSPEKPSYLDIEVKIEVEPDLYVGSPQAAYMGTSDAEDDVPELTGPAERVDAWAFDVTAAQEDGVSTEPPKRKRRKCTENPKNTLEIDPDEPKKVKPRRVYKKRIRAYIHVCEICQRVFNRTNHLKDHMKIHTDDRPHQCTVCQRRFIQKVNLRNHMMTHTGEKPYECEICCSGFIAKSDFKRHMNTHNEERNFECNLCHRRFTQLPYLKAHISTHTSEKPYECHICQRKFSQKPYLKNHLKRHGDRVRD